MKDESPKAGVEPIDYHLDLYDQGKIDAAELKICLGWIRPANSDFKKTNRRGRPKQSVQEKLPAIKRKLIQGRTIHCYLDKDKSLTVADYYRESQGSSEEDIRASLKLYDKVLAEIIEVSEAGHPLPQWLIEVMEIK